MYNIEKNTFFQFFYPEDQIIKVSPKTSHQHIFPSQGIKLLNLKIIHSMVLSLLQYSRTKMVQFLGPEIQTNYWNKAISDLPLTINHRVGPTSYCCSWRQSSHSRNQKVQNCNFLPLKWLPLPKVKVLWGHISGQGTKFLL